MASVQSQPTLCPNTVTASVKDFPNWDNPGALTASAGKLLGDLNPP